MPLTCSHPAAVLPFKRFKTLNFAALVIGSMSPDFGYFIAQRHLAKLAHRPFGTVAIDIPTGLIVLALFYLLRRELCFVLPAPHRNQLMPLAERKPRFTTVTFIVAAWSILLGAWTHIVWDQFTHDGNFINRHFAPLRIVLFHVGWYEMTVSHMLQYVSTIVGAAVLGWFYWRWLRSQSPKPTAESDNWRYALILVCALISLTIGILIAVRFAEPIHDSETLREFIYEMGVSAVSIFTLFIVSCSVLCYRRRSASADL